ncbi:MAG: stalk domain-containing protein [Candidatus Saccharibacteria bacterium]
MKKKSVMIKLAVFVLLVTMALPVPLMAADTQPAKPPAAPTDLVAKLVSETQISLTWKDNSTDETGFSIERSWVNAAGKWEKLPAKTVEKSVTSFNDIDLKVNSVYKYSVKAVNQAGSSEAVTAEAQTTLAQPALPNTIEVKAISSTSVSVTWTKVLNSRSVFIDRMAPDDVFYKSAGVVDGWSTSFVDDQGLVPNTKYKYRLTMQNYLGDVESKPVEVTTLAGKGTPAAPSKLESTVAETGKAVKLSWNDNSGNEQEFVLERKSGTEAYKALPSITAGATEYTDSTVSAGQSYSYRIMARNATGSSDYSNEASVSMPGAVNANATVLVFKLGSNDYTVNGKTTTMDTAPVSKNGRTLLPLKYLAAPLGATTSWDPKDKKVTVTLGETTICLWVGKNMATVNGVQTPIDPKNSQVVPTIMQGRTMLPLGFIAQNLGCGVDWNPPTQEATIAYPAPY